MKVSINFTDDGGDPGTLHGEVSIDFNMQTKDAVDALRKLQASNISNAIAFALSQEEPKAETEK